MDEARYAYHQDVAARSKSKNMTHHKKFGTSTTKLGNKPVSNQEIFSKNGPCVTYPSPDGLMEFSQFMRLPNDLAVEFIKGCCDRYDIQIKHISRYLFGLEDDELKRTLERKKIYLLCNPGKKRAKSGLLKFQADIEEWKRSTKIERDLKKAEAQERQKNAPKLMEFDAFKKLPMDDQIVYINSIIDFWQVPAKTIAMVLYGKSYGYFNTHFKNCDKSAIHRLNQKLIQNEALMYENKKAFTTYVEAWKEFKDEPEDKDPKPVEFRELTKEEGHEVISESFLKNLGMSDSEIQEKAKGILSSPKPVPGTMPPDDSFILDASSVRRDKQKLREWEEELGVVRVTTPWEESWYHPMEEPKPETEVKADPMEYHDMQFSVNYISDDINDTELYGIISLARRCRTAGKKYKVSFSISEV